MLFLGLTQIYIGLGGLAISFDCLRSIGLIDDNSVLGFWSVWLNFDS